VVSTDGGLDVNDVSFLIPLPAPGHEATLLALSDSDGRGVLLPRALYDGLPVLVEGTAPAELYARLRVVGIRVDPCFPGSTPPAAPSCLKQLRLVAQPLHVGGEDADFQTVSEDATVHLFNGLSDADFDEVHRGLWSLKALAGELTDGRPLGVHPVLEREGLEGAYGSALRSLVLRHCGAQNLTRVAFMSVATQGSLWRFGAFDVENGALVAAQIPRIGTTAQGFQEFGTPEFRSGQLMPTVSGDDLDVLRAFGYFGYFGRSSALSQRTINESAAIAEALSQTHP
jgi:hypothetical protein